MTWAEKYRPKSLKEFVDQKEALEEFLKWIKSWKPGSKALLLYGMPGVGKTALIQAYASEKNVDLIETNASDFRSANQIKRILGSSIAQASLFKKGKIFLIDEIDGIAGKEDKGGVGEIIKIIKSSRFPVVLTCNDPYDPKLRSLRQHCKLVQLKKIHVWDMVKRLAYVCKKEGIKASNDVLKRIASLSKGDLRAAINDLETVARGKKEICEKDLEALSYRETEESIFDALKMIFKTRTVLGAKLSIVNVDKDPDEIFWWIENNIANEYEKPEEIAKAFEALSKADLFRKRVSSRQDWRLKGYMIDLMTAGVSSAKEQVYKKFTKYRYPEKLAILGSTKQTRKEEKELLSSLSKILHCSTKKVKKEFLPFLKIWLKNKEMKESLLTSLGLDKQQAEILKNIN